jgi:hypothetical protein
LPPAVGRISRPLDAIVGTVVYLEDADQEPVGYNPPVEYGKPSRVGRFASFAVRIENARGRAGELSLDREGFVLTRHATAVRNFYDEKEVRAVYYPEVERLVKQATGAAKVVIFDHTLRVSSGENRAGTRGPVQSVHNDYTENSGPRRARDFLTAEEAETRLRRRFVEINVWQPIRGPVRRDHLGLIDASTIAPADLVAAKLVYADRVGEIYYGAYNPAHRWKYFPEMTVEEAILIKCYDSARDGRARFSLHAAFADPAAPADAPARESIETRTFAFLDE